MEPFVSSPDNLYALSPSKPQHSTRRIDHSINLADSLLAFYHQERMWCYRTRASLELILEPAPSTVRDSSITSSTESDTTAEEGDTSLAVVRPHGIVKTEPTSPANMQATTLWMRRKRSFKLKLEGISTRSRKRRTAKGQDAPPTPGVQILEMFERLMQARMESCERVSKLMKTNANQPTL